MEEQSVKEIESQEEQLPVDEQLEEVVVEEEVDLTSLNEQELYDTLKKVSQESDVRRAEKQVREIKQTFDKIYDQKRDEAFEKFMSDGGEKDGFEFKDKLSQDFFALSKVLQKELRSKLKEEEETKKKTYATKTTLLDELRALVDGEENINTIHRVREIQNQWRDLGAVPYAYVHELNSNYRAVLDRFYNNRGIYLEYLDLDRKKNLELKSKLCEEAEALLGHGSVKAAMDRLDELHQAFKEVGPVPKEEQENVWGRFKAATLALYEKRKQVSEEFKKELESNLVQKRSVIDKIQNYTELDSDSINQWKAWTEEVLAIQEEWKKGGAIPKSESKAVNREFWGLTKKFFANKQKFFKKLDAGREDNYKQKKELCERVEALLESDDARAASEEVKKIQADWKKIGQAPRKVNDKIYARFKGACDKIFDNLREARKELDKEFVVNLEAKKEVVKEIEGAKEATKESVTLLMQKFEDLGFVPRDAKNDLQKSFVKAVSDLMSSADIDQAEKDEVLIRAEFGSLKDHPNSGVIINKKRGEIRGKINTLENEVATLERNIEFFALSKNADELRADVQKKIEASKSEIEGLKKQLRLIGKFSS